MECWEAHVKLSPDLDGELSPAESESLRRHLLGCAGCARRRAALEVARRAYRSVARQVAAPDPRPATRAWAVAAAIAAVSAILLAPPWTSSPPHDSPASDARLGGGGGGELLVVDCGQVGATSCVLVTTCQPGDCEVDHPAAVVPLPELSR